MLACGETLQNYCGQNVRSSFVFPAAVDWERRTSQSRFARQLPYRGEPLADRAGLSGTKQARRSAKAWALRQRGGRAVAKRAYCKNTVKGSQRGRKYPPKVRAEVLMAMLSSGSICAVARRYGVPESTIRSWMAEEAGRSDAFAKERQAAAREIAIRASLGARAQVSYLQSRVDESQRAAQVQARLHRKLDEDIRARCFAVGTLLKSDAEELADATETGLVLYAAEDITGRLDERGFMELETAPLPSNTIAYQQNRVAELKENSGNRDVNQGGTTSGLTAASAIAALQEAGSKLSRDMLKSSYRSFAKECYFIIDLMRQFYDESRVYRITGQQGGTEYREFSGQMLRPQPVESVGGVELGAHEPVFDITVSAAKKSTFSRLSQNETAKECYQLGFFAPANADAALACLDILSNIDTENLSGDLQEKLK